MSEELQQAYVLFLPKWYPSRFDPQLGVFIRKHAEAVALYQKVIVLYVKDDPGLDLRSYIEVTDNENLTEYTAYYKKSVKFLSRLINSYRYFSLLNKMMKDIKYQYGAPEIIHSHVLLRTCLIAWFYARKFKVPYVHTEHWTGFVHDGYRRKSRVYRFLCRKVTKKAAALIVVSEALKEAMSKHKVINSNTFIIPNVIERRLSSQVREKGEKIKILTVADLVEKNKNISASLKVLAEIKALYPQLEFHVIGGGQDEEMLFQLARSIDPAAEWIFFYGKKDNDFVLEFLQDVDFLITNSNIETFSVITAEAIAAGKPVVATRSGGPEYFVNEQNGILISPGDPDELKEAVLKMIKSFSTYDPNTLSKDILNKYGMEAVGSSLLRLYKNTASK